jgi:acetolactate synthase-1/2/3 large subunit
VPGPVFVELPFDVLCAQVQDPHYPALPRPWPRQPGDPAAVDAAAKLLGAAQKPIVFAGSQIWWDDAAGALARFAEKTGIPVFTNAMGRGALAPEHPLAFNLARKKALRSADAVLVVGTPLDFRVGYGAAISAQARIIQIDRDPTKVAQNRDAEVALLGDARSILDQLAEATPARRLDAWVGELRADEEKQAAGIAGHAASNDRPINHYRLAKAIADAIDDDTIVIGDGGDCVALAARILAPKKPGHWLDPGPLGCLGVGAPFALAAKKLYPDKKVLVLSGDGSFGLNGFDFETAVRWKLPVTVVVANDAAWGQIRGPQVMIFGAERAPATKLAPTRYDKVVEAFGGRGYHVEDPTALTATIKKALDSGETSCVNVPIDPEFVLRIGASKLSV